MIESIDLYKRIAARSERARWNKWPDAHNYLVWTDRPDTPPGNASVRVTSAEQFQEHVSTAMSEVRRHSDWRDKADMARVWRCMSNRLQDFVWSHAESQGAKMPLIVVICGRATTFHGNVTKTRPRAKPKTEKSGSFLLRDHEPPGERLLQALFTSIRGDNGIDLDLFAHPDERRSRLGLFGFTQWRRVFEMCPVPVLCRSDAHVGLADLNGADEKILAQGDFPAFDEASLKDEACAVKGHVTAHIAVGCLVRNGTSVTIQSMNWSCQVQSARVMEIQLIEEEFGWWLGHQPLGVRDGTCEFAGVSQDDIEWR